jgi:hypothetical protein
MIRHGHGIWSLLASSHRSKQSKRFRSSRIACLFVYRNGLSLDLDSLLLRAYLELPNGLTLRKRPHIWPEQFCSTVQLPTSWIGRVDIVQVLAGLCSSISSPTDIPAGTKLLSWISRRGGSSWRRALLLEMAKRFFHPLASSVSLVIEARRSNSSKRAEPY